MFSSRKGAKLPRLCTTGRGLGTVAEITWCSNPTLPVWCPRNSSSPGGEKILQMKNDFPSAQDNVLAVLAQTGRCALSLS